MWKKKTALFGVAILVFGLSLVYLFPGHTAATTGVNPELSFEGKIVDGSGLNIPDGSYNVEFKIYTAAGSCNPTTGSGCTLGWTEDYLVSASQAVTFTSGTFQVNLGSINAFGGSIDWNTNPLYLSIQIGSTSSCTPSGNFTANCGGDGEMKPYILLTSTPYALNSDKLDGLDSAAFGQLAGNQTWTGTNTIQPTTNITGQVVKQTSVGSPTADIFNVQTENSTNIIQVTGPSADNAAVLIKSIGTGALTLQSGTGTISLGTTTVVNASGALGISSGGTTQTLSLATPASTSAATGAITIQSGSATVGTNLAAGTVTIDTGTQTGAGTAAINIGTANALATTVGNTSGASTVTLHGGTGGIIANGAASTTAFEVQNSSASNAVLFQVDSSNNNINLLGNNSAQLQTAVQATTSLPSTRAFHGTTTANGYIYVLGGDNGTAPTNSVYYAPLGANGQPGTWVCQGTSATTSCGGSVTLTNSNSLPTAREDVAAVAANGYLYLVDSSATTGDDATKVIYYAQLNADGSTGAWTSQASNLTNASRTEYGLVSANGYLYAIAGNNGTGSSGGLATTEYAKLNADGSTGAWTTSTSLPVSRFAAATAVANGYVYVLGGLNSTTDTHTIMFAPLNATTGALGTWKCEGSTAAAECSSSPAPVNSNTISATGVHNNGAAVANGYIYSLGGLNGSTAQSAINFGQLNADGTTGAWSSSTHGLFAARSAFGYNPTVANGYIYVAGGNNGGNQTTVYFNSVPRLQVGGALDLVGIGGETLVDGAAGGELTAGNTNIVGNLIVSGNANINQGLAVGDNFSVAGQALIGGLTSTNTTTAFQVQNSSGVNLLAVDTSGSNINVGSSAITETVQIGTTATNTSNTQTINIGNTAVAGTTNVTIGASPTSAGSGTTAVQSKGNLTLDSGAGISVGTTSATSLSFGSTANNASTTFKQTASATAFQVQNASSNAVFTVDTSGNQIVLGKASTVNGQFVLQNGTNANTVTIASGTTSVGYSISLPTAAGSASQCLQYGGSGSQLQWGACGTNSTGLAKNATDSSSAAAGGSSYLYQFTNSSSAVASGVLQLTNGTNTNSTLFATASGNPSANQAVIYGSNTNASPTGNLLLLQAGSGPTTILTVSAAGSVLIGSNSTANTNQDLLQLNSVTTFTEAATCSTSTNQGGMYYNTTTNTVRGCINGNWEDLASTSGLGILLYGVVPDSGSGAGDLEGITSAGVNGPCKVSFLSTTTVKIVQGCTAYSGGRKVTIPDNTTPTGSLTLTSGNFVHVCLTGTNNQPAFSASGAEAADMPTFSVNNPILCLADIKAGAAVLSNIYDLRTFTTTTKSFATLNATTGILGGLVAQSATAGVVSLTGAATAGVRGVIVSTAGSGATNNVINMIIAIRGTQYVKATGTSAVNSFVQGVATAGYTGTAAISATGYANLGVAQRTIDTTCAAAANCQFSQLVDINPR
jgi:hypothetical protein